jgi:hypothetical protein
MMPANKIPRSSYFPTANYGSYDSSFSGGTSLANSLFYQVADDGLYLVGMVQRYILAPNIDTILVSTIKPKQLTLPIPLALGVYRTYRDTMDSPGKREIRTDEFLVNGFGTMTFPNGVTTSVLRVRHKETRLTYKNNVLTATDWGTMIDYWAKDFTCLSLDMNDSSFTTGSGQVKNIDFSKWGALTDARDGNPALANAIVLDQNFPNPFNPVTTISFTLNRTSAVSISVHNALGEPVAMLLNGEKGAGAHSVVWNAVGMPSGVYFYEIRTPEYREVKKLMLMK